MTGGGTGIGAATALELARTGASIVICGRRAEPLAAVQAAIEAAGGACLVVDGGADAWGQAEPPPPLEP